MTEHDALILERKKLLEAIEHPLLDSDSPEYTSLTVNWIEAKTWEEVKNLNIKFLTNENRLVVLSHYNDFIKGKPQLIHQTVQKIPLLKKIEKVIRGKKGEEDKTMTGYKFLDDRFDKRYDGSILANVAFDFWVYRLIEAGKEYYLLSESPLSEEYSEMIGMKMDIDDLSGISDTLKVNKIATMFLVKSFKPAVKILSKEDLISFSKDTSIKHGWTEQGFMDFIFTHPDGNVYEYTPEFNKLRIAQFLSGRYEGYPLHLMKIGPVGTGKTTEAEAIDFKFREELGILEAGTSTMKVLVPSFKEKPANLGYICNCNRIAVIDELMKMVQRAIQHQHQDMNNYFGELNMLLEHKKRLVGSGNDNSTIIKTTAKVCITTNPLKGKNKLANHLSVLDNTTLSRMLIWVQDKAETDKIYQKEGIRANSLRNKPNPRLENNEQHLGLDSCDYVVGEYFDFLTIYDSCQAFIIDYELAKVKEIFNKSVALAREPMKQVWRSRGLHHAILILDGITKFRCLFKDQVSNFVATPEDYIELDRIITKMINGWDSDLENNWEGGF